MNINRDPIAPLGVIFPPFNQMDPKQSQKGINFHTILAKIILLEVQNRHDRVCLEISVKRDDI